MSDLRSSISRLLRGAGEAAMAPRRACLVGGTARGSVTATQSYQVRRESRDGKGRRIVERWTESVRPVGRG